MTEPDAATFARYLLGGGRRAPRPPARPLRRFLRREEVAFTLRFAALAFLAWIFYVPFSPEFEGFAVLTAGWAAAGAQALGMEAVAAGTVVAFGGGAYRYDVTVGCTGVFVCFLFAAALLAYPASGRDRAVGLAVGIPLLLAVNWARLLSMAWLGLRHPAWAEHAHVFWWQAFLLLVTGIGWLAWIRLVVERPRGAERAARVGEIARAAATFALALALLALLGAASPVDEAYVALVRQAAGVLASALGVQAAAAPFPTLPAYGTLAGALALFLATPRAGWALKARGALAWGALACVLAQVATLAAIHAALGGAASAGVAWALLLSTLQMASPAAAWYAWTRKHRLLAGADVARRYACPACRRERADVLDHVRKAHGPRAHALVRALVRRHPELDEEVRTGAR